MKVSASKDAVVQYCSLSVILCITSFGALTKGDKKLSDIFVHNQFGCQCLLNLKRAS